MERKILHQRLTYILFRERRLCRQFTIPTPEGYEADNRPEHQKKIDLIDTVRTGAIKRAEGMERHVPPKAREVAANIAKLEQGLRRFKELEIEMRTNGKKNRFFNLKQLELIDEINEHTTNADGKLSLSILNGKLAIAGGDVKTLENFIDEIVLLRQQHSTEYAMVEHFSNMEKAAVEYLEVAKRIATLRKTIATAPVGAIARNLDQTKNLDGGEFVGKYPLEYLRLVKTAVQRDPNLVRRLEPGGADAEFISENGFREFIVTLLKEGKHEVLDSLSEEYKKDFVQYYRSAALEGAKDNPAVLKKVNYGKHWKESYTPEPEKKGKDAPAEVTYQSLIEAATSFKGKTLEKREAALNAIYDVDTDWLYNPLEKNRDWYHKKFIALASEEESPVIAGLNEPRNRALLENYKTVMDSKGEDKRDTGVQGWAYAVRDIIAGIKDSTDEVSKKNPDALTALGKETISDLKSRTPEVYRQIAESARENPRLALRLGDPDVIAYVLEKKSFELLQELKKTPSLITSIPSEIRNDQTKRGEPEQSNKERVMDLVSQHAPLLDYIPEWQKDGNILLGLVQSNADIFAHMDASFRGDEKMIYAALRAEQEGKGNFHWESVPKKTYDEMIKKLKGGDPDTKRFLPYLLDPKYYEAPDEQKLFHVMDSIPEEQQTPENLLQLISEFKKFPELFTRIKNKETKKDLTFLKNLLQGVYLKSAPEVMRYIMQENFQKETGLSWEDLAALARDTKTLAYIDYKKLPLPGMDALIGAVPSAERGIVWRSVPETTLAHYLHEAGENVSEEMLREIGSGKIRALIGSSESVTLLEDDVPLLHKILKQYPTLIGAMPPATFQDFDALWSTADRELRTYLIDKSGQKIAEIEDETSRSRVVREYWENIQQFAIESKENSDLLRTANMKLFKNAEEQKEFIEGTLVRLETRAENPATPISKEDFKKIRSNVLDAATDDVLKVMIIEQSEENPEIHTLIDLKRLDRLLKADARTGGGSLILALLPNKPEVLDYATPGNLLDHHEFILNVFAGLLDHPRYDSVRTHLLTRATDRALAAALFQGIIPNAPTSIIPGEESFLRLLPEPRLRHVLAMVGAEKNETFFSRVIRIRKQSDFLQYASIDLRNNGAFIDGLLEEKDPRKAGDKPYIQSILRYAHPEQTLRLTKTGAPNAEEFRKLQPDFSISTLDLWREQAGINKEAVEAKREKLVERHAQNVEAAMFKEPIASAPIFAMAHSEVRSNAKSVQGFLENADKRWLPGKELIAVHEAIYRSATNGALVAMLASKEAGTEKRIGELREQPRYLPLLQSDAARNSPDFYVNILKHRLCGLSAFKEVQTTDAVADSTEVINTAWGKATSPEDKELVLSHASDNQVLRLIDEGGQDKVLPYLPSSRRTMVIQRTQESSKSDQSKLLLISHVVKLDPQLIDVVATGRFDEWHFVHLFSGAPDKQRVIFSHASAALLTDVLRGNAYPEITRIITEDATLYERALQHIDRIDTLQKDQKLFRNLVIMKGPEGLKKMHSSLKKDEDFFKSLLSIPRLTDKEKKKILEYASPEVKKKLAK